MSNHSKSVDSFESVLEEVRNLHDLKTADYAQDTDPFSNFRDSARQVGITPGQSVEVLIATKQSRLRQLLGEMKEPKNESIRDTLRDRVVYSVIALVMLDAGLYEMDDQ
jgi:hypothetical protein